MSKVLVTGTSGNVGREVVIDYVRSIGVEQIAFLSLGGVNRRIIEWKNI